MSPDIAPASASAALAHALRPCLWSACAWIAAAAVPLHAAAQSDRLTPPRVVQQVPLTPQEAETLFTGPHLFFGLVAGLVLALAFQLLLTMLSAATGISSLGDLEEKARKPADRPDAEDPERRYYHEGKEGRTVQEDLGRSQTRAHTPSPEHLRAEREERKPRGGVLAGVRKLNHAFGAWTLATACISLFFAAWLAVEIAMTVQVLVGVVIGLSIWGLFTIVATLLESNAILSLGGGLMKLATGTLRSAGGGLGAVFGRSDQAKLEEGARSIAAAVRDELLEDERIERLKREVRDYVARLEPQKLDLAEVRKELETLLNRTELRALVEEDEHSPRFQELVTASLRTRRGPDAVTRKQVGERARSAVEVVREETRRKGPAAGAVDSAMRLAGVPSEKAEALRKRIGEYLRNTGREELDPEGIERDLNLLLQDPKLGLRALGERVTLLDRNAIAAILAQRGDMDEQAAQGVIAKVESVLKGVSDFMAGRKPSEPTARPGSDPAGAHPSGGAGDQEDDEGLLDRALHKVQRYLDNLDQPELGYAGLREDFARIAEHPREGAAALLQRLRAMDRDTLAAIIASTRRDMSKEDADELLARLERRRDEMIAKVERARDQVLHRLEEARLEAVHQAEEVRKVAATASWWAVGTALASGVCAALGGAFAALTGMR